MNVEIASTNAALGDYEQEWSDNACTEFSKRSHIPEVVLDQAVQKNIVTRFIDFYIDGKKPKGLDAGDLVLAVISIIPKDSDTEEPIFIHSDYNERGSLFTLPPGDIVLAKNTTIETPKESSLEELVDETYQCLLTNILIKSLRSLPGLDELEQENKCEKTVNLSENLTTSQNIEVSQESESLSQAAQIINNISEKSQEKDNAIALTETKDKFKEIHDLITNKVSVPVTTDISENQEVGKISEETDGRSDGLTFVNNSVELECSQYIKERGLKETCNNLEKKYVSDKVDDNNAVMPTGSYEIQEIGKNSYDKMSNEDLLRNMCRWDLQFVDKLDILSHLFESMEDDEVIVEETPDANNSTQKNQENNNVEPLFSESINIDKHKDLVVNKESASITVNSSGNKQTREILEREEDENIDKNVASQPDSENQEIEKDEFLEKNSVKKNNNIIIQKVKKNSEGKKNITLRNENQTLNIGSENHLFPLEKDNYGTNEVQSESNINQSFEDHKLLLETLQEVPRKITRNIIIEKKKTPKIIDTNFPDYGPVHKSVFRAMCNQLLAQWDTNKNARIVLKYFCGVVGLILMRGIAKDYRYIVYSVTTTKFLSHVQYINDFSENVFQYSVINEKCLNSSYRFFQKRKENARVMLAKIVSHSVIFNAVAVLCDVVKNETPRPKLLFNDILLSHIVDYGLELISMVQNIQIKFIDRSINLLIDATTCEETLSSWERVKEFLSKYKMVASTKVFGYHWARLIDENYFRDLACDNNYSLAVILAVFNEKLFWKSNIWTEAWVEKGNNLETYKELGLRMYENYIMGEE